MRWRDAKAQIKKHITQRWLDRSENNVVKRDEQRQLRKKKKKKRVDSHSKCTFCTLNTAARFEKLVWILKLSIYTSNERPIIF